MTLKLKENYNSSFRQEILNLKFAEIIYNNYVNISVQYEYFGNFISENNLKIAYLK